MVNIAFASHILMELYLQRSVLTSLKIAGLKLDAHSLTIATAATLYHRFIKEATPGGYDNYVNINSLSIFIKI